MNICYKIDKKLAPDINRMENHPRFSKKNILTSSHLSNLLIQLEKIKDYWGSRPYELEGYLVQANFSTIISKSKRIQKLFNGDKKMRGAHFRYSDSGDRRVPKHSMVFLFNDEKDIEQVINKIKSVLLDVDNEFDGIIDNQNFNRIDKCMFGNSYTKEYNISLALELCRVESFSFPDNHDKVDVQSLVHFYVDPTKIFELLGIRTLKSSIFNNTVLLNKEDINRIIEEAPYFVASTYNEIISQPNTNSYITDKKFPELPEPTNEPTIGVFDTPFDINCCLNNSWVTTSDLRSIKNDDAMENSFHGTEVCSLLVCGNLLNEELGLDDNCGLFKVKHFAIANKDFTSTIEIMQNIKKVIEDKDNKDIKVWNISLGTISEVNKFFISPVAALLDQLQIEHPDIIFVVAATNNNDINNRAKTNYRIGSPADSINSLVVGSTRFGGEESTSYARKGGVLDFFIKPDVCYFGGDEGKEIFAFNGCNVVKVCGTSFATPLITRKLAYLMYNLDLPREIAKALIIDSATKWKQTYKEKDYLGRGVVPITIQDILLTEEDETRLIYSNEIVNYSSFDYSLPLPLNENNNINFRARVTMSYFTPCKVEFGVDYTNVEVDLKFGSIKDGKIKSLKPNKQYEDSLSPEEKEARDAFSKWDNIKIIKSKEQNKFGDSWSSKNNWGFDLHTIYRNENLNSSQKYNFKFGIVITLKSLDGKNHTTDIVKTIQDSEWKIKPIIIKNISEFTSRLRSTVEFDEED